MSRVRLRPPLPSGPYVVLGLARSGQAAALALRARGEAVIGVDAGHPEVDALRAAGIDVRVGDDGGSAALGAHTLVKSPGVPQEAPLVRAARDHGLAVLGELELGWRMLPNEVVAVTGTNGKTTVTEWLGHVYREAGVSVAVAGNVGTPVSALVGSVHPEATLVLECSSFQLEDTEFFAPEAAALLNLAPDHIDRHGTFEAYSDAKLRIFRNQGNDDIAVAPCDLGIADLGGCARRICFGEGPEAEVADRAGELWWADQPLLRTDELALPGPHNRRNALAVVALSLARGLPVDAVVSALKSFPGVVHRLERVAVRDGVRFVNDSKATNVASTQVALASFPPGTVHLIAGGQGKGGSFAELAGPVATACRAVYLIGETAGQLAEDLAGAGVPLERAGDLEHAVAAARAAARPGETVLLSPACASYDQFANYEARGMRSGGWWARRRPAGSRLRASSVELWVVGARRSTVVAIAGSAMHKRRRRPPRGRNARRSSRVAAPGGVEAPREPTTPRAGSSIPGKASAPTRRNPP